MLENTDQQTTPEVSDSTPANPPANPNPPVETRSTDGSALRSELENLRLGALSELHKENARLQSLLAERNSTPVAAPQSDDVAAFLANPRQAIRDEMQALIAPLTQFVSGVKQKDAYSDLKDQFRSNPQLGKLLTDHEQLVDQIMQTSDKTPGNLQAAIFAAVGMKSSGLFESTPSNPTPPVNNNPNPTTPPYIPSSPPAPPRTAPPANDLKSKVDALTEQERGIAKTFGLSFEEYVTLRDADTTVSSWTGGNK